MYDNVGNKTTKSFAYKTQPCIEFNKLTIRQNDLTSTSKNKIYANFIVDAGYRSTVIELSYNLSPSGARTKSLAVSGPMKLTNLISDTSADLILRKPYGISARLKYDNLSKTIVYNDQPTIDVVPTSIDASLTEGTMVGIIQIPDVVSLSWSRIKSYMDDLENKSDLPTIVKIYQHEATALNGSYTKTLVGQISGQSFDGSGQMADTTTYSIAGNLTSGRYYKYQIEIYHYNNYTSTPTITSVFSDPPINR